MGWHPIASSTCNAPATAASGCCSTPATCNGWIANASARVSVPEINGHDLGAVRAIAPGPAGGLWLASETGLWRFETSTPQIHRDARARPGDDQPDPRPARRRVRHLVDRCRRRLVASRPRRHAAHRSALRHARGCRPPGYRKPAAGPHQPIVDRHPPRRLPVRPRTPAGGGTPRSRCRRSAKPRQQSRHHAGPGPRRA
jgi:hypothetical protein